MDPAAPLTALAPAPMSSPSPAPASVRASPESVCAASAGNAPVSGPPVPAAGPVDMRNVRASCLFGAREYVTLLRKRQHVDGGAGAAELEARIRDQASLVVGDLRTLQSGLRGVAEAAEGRRWRRWLLGGVVAALIPAVRAIFRRSADEQAAGPWANDTEYAFDRSRSLTARIRDGLLGGGRLAQAAIFVLAVLYVFQNEVTLRAARTAQRRLGRLCHLVEAGEGGLDDGDVAMLEGWRWRILFW